MANDWTYSECGVGPSTNKTFALKSKWNNHKTVNKLQTVLCVQTAFTLVKPKFALLLVCTHFYSVSGTVFIAANVPAGGSYFDLNGNSFVRPL